jgi:hypothetical protein
MVACLRVGVMLGMQLGSRIRMVFGMLVMAVRGVGVMGGGLDILVAMMVRGLAVMLGRLLVMGRGGLVMVGDLRRVRHGVSPDWLMDDVSAFKVPGAGDRGAAVSVNPG